MPAERDSRRVHCWPTLDDFSLSETAQFRTLVRFLADARDLAEAQENVELHALVARVRADLLDEAA